MDLVHFVVAAIPAALLTFAGYAVLDDLADLVLYAVGSPQQPTTYPRHGWKALFGARVLLAVLGQDLGTRLAAGVFTVAFAASLAAQVDPLHAALAAAALAAGTSTVRVRADLAYKLDLLIPSATVVAPIKTGPSSSQPDAG